MKNKKSIFSILVIVGLIMPIASPAFAFEPFVGQIMPVAFNFCPRGWAEANGQTLPINANTALFSLLGTTYGGDGRSTFRLPDLRGRSPVHVGSGLGLPTIQWGQQGGSTDFTLTVNNLPAHSHLVDSSGISFTAARGRATTDIASGNYVAERSGIFRPGNSLGTTTSIKGLSLTGSTLNTGNSTRVDKRSPFLGAYYCIALEGLFPSRN